MIKPIIYHSFQEKQKIEQELLAQIPIEKEAVAKELMSIFYNASRKKSAANSPKPRKKN